MTCVPSASFRSANLSPCDGAQKRSKFTNFWSVAVAALAVWSASALQSSYTAQASAAISSPGPVTSVFESWQAPPASSPSGNSTLLGEANPATELDVTFGLALQRSDLPQLVQSLSTPGASSYRHYESVGWLAGHTGATEATSTAVLGYLRSQGVDGHLDPTASYVEAAVSVAQAAKLFGTSFGRYYFNGAYGWDTDLSGVVVAPRSVPQLPSALRGRVTLVYGLQAYPTLTVYPNSVLQEAPTRPSLLGGSFGGLGTAGGCAAARIVDHVPTFTPKQYLTAYGVEALHGEGLLGEGQAVAIISEVPATQSNLASFTRCFGLATPPIRDIQVGTGTTTALDDLDAHGEIALDTEMVAAMAPRLSDIDVIYDPDGSLVDRLDATLNRSLIHGPMPKVVSYSGGGCEPLGSSAYSNVALQYALTDHILMDMAANGISFVAAAGDTGSSCNQANAAIAGARLSVSFPASSPYATSAGGELMGLNAADQIQGQRVWDDLPLGSGLAGGGGQSAVFGRPWYQQHLTTAGHGRLVPDVALEADLDYPIANYCTTGCNGYGWARGGGTSAATPLMAGGIALADQGASLHGQAPLGLVNPLLYQLGAAHSKALVNITLGNNDVYALGCCTAKPGYNDAAGWGSVNFPQFVTAAVSAGRE
jgi:subtilase family serine protease